MAQVSCFSVKGPILVDNAASVGRDGAQAVNAGISQIDLAGVTELDSSSVAVVLSWLRLAKSLGRQLTFLNVPPSIHKLAAVYGVTEFLP